MPDTDMRVRAARGAALLDLTHPHWHEGVSVAALNVLKGHACVLGQIYGNYETGLERLFPNESTYVYTRATPDLGATSNYYGFSAFDMPPAPDGTLRAWDELTQAWRDLISERRCQALNLDLYDLADEKVNVSA